MIKLIVDAENIRKNVSILKGMTDAKLIGVVKCRGYGLGLLPFSKLLLDSGVDMLAVTSLDEALFLREKGIMTEMLLMAPVYKTDDIKASLYNELVLTLSTLEGAKTVNAVAKEMGYTARAHVAVDTGFGRFGFAPDQAEQIVKIAEECENVQICGIFSHLYDSGGRNAAHSTEQLGKLAVLCDKLSAAGIDPGMRHIANSAAILRFPDMHLDAVRAGSALLGRATGGTRAGLIPFGYMSTEIIEKRTLPKGHGIGYGAIYKTKRETDIAVVPVGSAYGVGLSRVSGKAGWLEWLRTVKNAVLSRPSLTAKIGGKVCPVLGMLGVNTAMIDVTAVQCEIGDEVRFDVNPMMVDSEIPREYINK